MGDPGRDFPVRRPSWLWSTTAIVATALAAVVMVSAWLHQRAADRPIGEGALFAEDATEAMTRLQQSTTSGAEAGVAVRRIRNDLGVEAVALVEEDGTITAASSQNLVGSVVTHPFLHFILSRGSFGAVAARVPKPIEVGGVVEWSPDSILYMVLEARGDSPGGLILYYDMSELLARRARASGVSTGTLQLVGAGLGLLAVVAIALYGRARAAAHYREVAVETELLRRHSTELESANRKLAAARRRAEEALRLAEEKNRIRAEFVLMINHELRTPLTAVVTGAELLQSGVDMSGEDTHRLVTDMVADGRRLHEMIDQMLTVARIENRGLNFDLQETTVGELCDDIEKRDQRVGVDASTDPAVRQTVVSADRMTFPQVIRSLTDNAFTHGASRVTLECAPSLPFRPSHEVGERPRPAFHFVLHDDGPGIEPDFIPRAFEKFEKHSRSSGTGLGLYLAATMVVAMGGSISVHSSPDGTSIAVSLPAHSRQFTGSRQ